MKILVNNSQEKELVEKFFNMIADIDMIEDIEKIDNTFSVESNEEPYLTSLDYEFLRQGFFNHRILADSTVYPLTIEGDNIQGVCTVCGTYTEGRIDGNEVSYSEFLDYSSEEVRKTWKCETCFFNSNED